MSFKRGPKPARPPPPKGGLALGGLSFKKLEQEEEDEEDLTLCTDKYASLVQHVRSSSTPPISSASTKIGPDSSTPESDIKLEDSGRSSPLRKIGAKSMFEYKEILSGLKDRIQGKISKTLEDLSGESSASTSPDKELPSSISVGENLDANKQKDIVITKSLISKLGMSAKPTSDNPAGSEKETIDGNPLEIPSTNALSDSNSIGHEDQEILVVEEHFTEPLEDFLGSPVLNRSTSTAARSRSKLSGLKKKNSSITVSMSGLTSDTIDIGSQVHTAVNSANIDKMQEKPKTVISHSPTLLLSHLSSDNCVSWQKLLIIISILFIYLIVPIPAYLSGLITGSALTSLVWFLYTWIMRPPTQRGPIILTPIEDLPPMQIPEMKDPVSEDGVYKGWMNEIAEYNPENYHINDTHSIFVTLEGTRLRLQRPKASIPKRAMHDENISMQHFIHQRHFELKDSRVFLKPENLVKKRLWSKKYPVCIALSDSVIKQSLFEESRKRNSSDALIGRSLDKKDKIDSIAASLGKKKYDHSASSPAILGEPKVDLGFELVSEEKCDESILYLFARTGREKEEWYKRFQAAAMGKPIGNPIMEMRRAIERKRTLQDRQRNSADLNHQRHNSSDSQASISDSDSVELEIIDPLLDFTQYMGHLMPAGALARLMSPSHSGKVEGKDGDKVPRTPFTGSIICDSQLYWLNALIGRCFFDFLRDHWWTDKVKEKLQKKLSKIHVPYFIEELQVTAIDMGKEMPVIRRSAHPYLDDRGFWVELDVSYTGSFQMTIVTKINLMKLKRTDPKTILVSHTVNSDLAKSPVTDSDEEDSAESSTDEEEEAGSIEEGGSSQASKKLLKYIDKLTQSKYFQQATEYKYIKRAMENVSNTPLQLAVQVKSLVGKLAINIPPPPTDRLWYGFRGPPRLWLVAKPQVGERAVTLTHVTEWIERKLEIEFQRVFVMPNMDDVLIPILRPGENNASAQTAFFPDNTSL